MSFMTDKDRRRCDVSERDLKHTLDRANDALAVGNPPLQGDMKALETAYGRANNSAPCPCGSGLKYKKCCSGR